MGRWGRERVSVRWVAEKRNGERKARRQGIEAEAFCCAIGEQTKPVRGMDNAYESACEVQSLPGVLGCGVDVAWGGRWYRGIEGGRRVRRGRVSEVGYGVMATPRGRDR